MTLHSSSSPPSPPDLEIRALKIYSPNGPRNGVVIIFLTQSSKSLWLSSISEQISICTPDPIFPPSPSPPLANGSVPHATPPSSPSQNSVKRRVSMGTVTSEVDHDSPSHTPLSGSFKLEDSSMRNSPILISRTTSFTFSGDNKQFPDVKYVE